MTDYQTVTLDNHPQQSTITFLPDTLRKIFTFSSERGCDDKLESSQLLDNVLHQLLFHNGHQSDTKLILSQSIIVELVVVELD